MAKKQGTNDAGKKREVSRIAPKKITLPQDYRDVSNQELFKNHVLCAQFLRDYSGCEALKNVQAEDIEDLSERFTSIMGTKVEGDTVKRIHLRALNGEELELYAVSLIEHKSDVDYDVAMQLLHYISNIWRDYARNVRHQTLNGGYVEVNKAKAFRYPPVLPIVYYEGMKQWTAGMQLRDRVQSIEGLEAYIPDFAYKLVRIQDYSNADLLGRENEISLIMLLNKIQTAEELHRMLDVPAEAINRIVSNSPEPVLEVIRDVIYLLCRKVNMPKDETCEILSQIKEGRNMGYLFENMEHMDIQEERRRTQEANVRLEKIRAERKKAEAERRQAEEKLTRAEEERDRVVAERKQAEEKLTRTKAELEKALKELERYRTAEKEKCEA